MRWNGFLRYKTVSGSSSSEIGAEAFRVFSRGGRWWKERKAGDEIPSKMFILFSKTKEKTNAYGGRGRREKLLLCDRKLIWTLLFKKTARETGRLPITVFVYISGLTGSQRHQSYVEGAVDRRERSSIA